MTFSAAAELTGGTLHGMDGVFSGVRIDSRAVQRGELFVAIRGDRLDGHDFVADAADRGAAGALVAAGRMRISARSPWPTPPSPLAGLH